MSNTSIILGVDDILLNVRVMDDGMPLLVDKTITITLRKRAGGTTNDIILSEATLIIRAAKGENTIVIAYNYVNANWWESEASVHQLNLWF